MWSNFSDQAASTLIKERIMIYCERSEKQLKDEPLLGFVKSVHGLSDKLGRIASGKKEIASSLSRAAVALRSMAALNKR